MVVFFSPDSREIENLLLLLRLNKSFFVVFFSLFLSPCANGSSYNITFFTAVYHALFLCSFEIYFRLFLWYCCSSLFIRSLYTHFNELYVITTARCRFPSSTHFAFSCLGMFFRWGVTLCTFKWKLVALSCSCSWGCMEKVCPL